MPLSQSDTARLYSDAFATNMKTLAGENAFVIADLKTQLDVAKMANGVLQDDLDAASKQVAELQAAATPPPSADEAAAAAAQATA